jgi:tetratricopeptide (TPR) repeat protein
MSDNISCNGRYEVLPSNLPAGSSGIPGLAQDTQTGEIVFTKTADLNSPDYNVQLQSLTNEAMVLKELAGFGVPTLLDVCREKRAVGTEFREYLCLIMENITDAECVGNIYHTLTFIERIEILLQFFGCLANAHAKRIINGDIDLKHLYWKRDKRELVVIDWGNARNGTQANDYVSDLFESGEIVYSLLTLEAFPLDQHSPLAELPQETTDIFRNLVNLSRQKNQDSIVGFSVQNLRQAAHEWKTVLVNQLLERADENFDSGGRYKQAYQLYHEVLRWDPRNSRARIQVLKADYKRAEETPQEIPVEALRLYSVARSLMRAGRLAHASDALKQAIEIAEQAGVDFTDARHLYKDIQINLQNVRMAEEVVEGALFRLEKREWAKALEQLEYAVNLDSETNATTLLNNLRDLLTARSLIEQIQTGIGDDSLRLIQLTKIEQIIKATSETIPLGALWNDVVRRYGEINPKAKEAEKAVQKQEANQRQAQQVGTLFKSISWGIVSSIILILFALWFIYLLPRQTAVVDCKALSRSLSVYVTFPAYLANGDEGEIQVTLANEVNASTAISGTVLIDFQGPAKTRNSDPNSSNVIQFASLAPGERKSTNFKFTLNEPIQLVADPTRYLEFGLFASPSNQPCEPSKFHIAVAPIYSLRSAIAFLWGSIGLAIVGLLWNRIKKWLGQ